MQIGSFYFVIVHDCDVTWCVFSFCRLPSCLIFHSPTPAPARYSIAGQPSPPAPTTSMRACLSANWPARSSSFRHIGVSIVEAMQPHQAVHSRAGSSVGHSVCTPRASLAARAVCGLAALSSRAREVHAPELQAQFGQQTACFVGLYGGSSRHSLCASASPDPVCARYQVSDGNKACMRPVDMLLQHSKHDYMFFG